MEANAKVAKEHGYTGIPNGDAGLLEPEGPASDEPLTEEELNMTGEPEDEPEEELEWVEDEDGEMHLEGSL